MPERIVRKRTKGWRWPETAVYVGRGTKWGNQFRPNETTSHKDCLKLYIKFMFPFLSERTEANKIITQININEIQTELKGRDLVCWCKKGMSCHADTLLEVANNESLLEILRR